MVDRELDQLSRNRYKLKFYYNFINYYKSYNGLSKKIYSNGTSNKKKKYPKVLSGLLHLQTTSNNTIVNFTHTNGNSIISAGAWRVWFKGTKESSAYAAEMAANC